MKKKSAAKKSDLHKVISDSAEQTIEMLAQWRAYHKDTTGKTNPPPKMPHYALSPEGSFVYALCLAIKANDVEEAFLRQKIEAVIQAIKKTAATKRISDAIKMLEKISPIDDSIKKPFHLISLEFAQLEELPFGKKLQKGISLYAGKKFGNNLYVDKDSQFIKVGSDKYLFTGPDNWVVIDRVLQALFNRDEGYVIDITTEEHNALKKGAKTFFDKFCERKEKPKKQRRGNEKFYPLARVLHEKILTAP